MRRLYAALIRIAAPIAAAAALIRGLRTPAYRRHLGERFGFGAPMRESGGIWLHAVSLGEVNAAAALVAELRRRHPGVALLVTTATPTGRARAQAAFAGAAEVRYLPYDTPRAVARFLSNVRPAVAVVMETELWPNLFAECARRAVPIVLASARLSTRSVRRYRRFGGLFRDLFAADVTIAAQTEEDASRFCEIGADPARVQVIGNVKFDYEPGADVATRARRLREAGLGMRPVWVAGSTHPGEDEQVLDAHRRVSATTPGVLLVLAPRHPRRFEAVASLLEARGLHAVRRSSGAGVGAAASVLLLDTVGELATFYGAADVAFVGGSLVPIGGHNLLEPAALGVPVLTGPSNENGRDAAALLVGAGAAWIVEDSRALAEALTRLFADPPARARAGAAGRRAIESQRGSARRLLDLVDSKLAAGSGARAGPDGPPGADR